MTHQDAGFAATDPFFVFHFSVSGCNQLFEQLLEFRRLLHIIEGSRLETFDSGIDGPVPGQENDLDNRIQAFDLFQGGDAVHLRHSDVEYHHIAGCFFESGQTLVTIECGANAVAFVGQAHFQDFDEIPLVINDQDVDRYFEHGKLL